MKLIIDIDCDLLNRIHGAKSVPDMCGTDIVNAINAIKSGVPTYERQTGEWHKSEFRTVNCFYGKFDYLCSICTNRFDDPYPFCPNCGAKMEMKGLFK